ncbi:MAG: hypothetical protein ABJA64_00750 [Candidatus Saccharibacteria bacterium]
MDLTFEAPSRELVVQGIENWSPSNLENWEIKEVNSDQWKAVQLNLVP